MSKIIGNTTTTPVPRSDFLQNDKTKADYILNRPTLGAIAEKDIVDKTDLSSDVQSSLAEIETKSNIVTLTTEEYNAIVEAEEQNANTLYVLTDTEEKVVKTINGESPDETGNIELFTEEDALICLAELNIIEPMMDDDGNTYINDDGIIYSL